MTPKEHLIERFKELCKKHGIEAVADSTESSLENLKQIVAGTLLPSKSPRGVGPNLQRRLDAAYPGWSGLGEGLTTHQQQRNLDTALETLGIALAAVAQDKREAVALNLAGWARDGGRGPWQSIVSGLLQAPSTKRQHA